MALQKLDLSGGVLNRDRIYRSPNGVTVTSSANTYYNSNYYYLGYLFNETYQTDPRHYWLTSSSGNVTLTFDLTSVYDFVVKQIRVYPYTRTNASSNYRIEVSSDGLLWEEVVGWVYNHHNPNNANYIPAGQYREHHIEYGFKINYIRFTLTRNGSYGATLNEIELYGVFASAPNVVEEVYDLERERYLSGEEVIVSWSEVVDPERRPVTYRLEMYYNGSWNILGTTSGSSTVITLPQVEDYQEVRFRVISCNNETCTLPTEGKPFLLIPYVILLKLRDEYKTLDQEGNLIDIETNIEEVTEKGLLDIEDIDASMFQRASNLKLVVVDCTNVGRKVVVDGLAKIGYRYESKLTSPNEVLLTTLTDTLYDSRNVTDILPLELFNMIPSYNLRVDVYLDNGMVITDETTVSIKNTPPQIDASFEDNMLDVIIEDVEGDLFTYQIRLNDRILYPRHTEWGEYTKRFEYTRLLNSRDFIIGEPNKLEIIAKDHYGETNIFVIDFIGEYLGLMFADIHGNFYSTELGEVIKYLQIDPMMAGQSSLIYPIRLINYYNFKVGNILLWSDKKDMQGIEIQLSKTESPFEPVQELRYEDVVLDKYDEIMFYVRIVSHHSALTGGIFDVITKADVVD